MSKFILAIAGAAVALTAAPGGARTYVCTHWHDGVCISAHHVKGTPPPFATGYVFGQSYAYTPYSALPRPLVSYYDLDANSRYVYSNGYLYVVDPTTWAVTRVIDTFPH